jgi:Ohr subfamily peroxiredoxin
MISTAILDGDKILYTARTRTTGGREGQSRSDDGRLDVRLATPGSAGAGTNPEQLFAAGWSACFEGAMGIAARKRRVALPPETAIDAEVDLVMGNAGYSLAARMNISLPGVDRSTAREIVAEAETTCPYSKAVAGNVPVEINLV